MSMVAFSGLDLDELIDNAVRPLSCMASLTYATLTQERRIRLQKQQCSEAGN